MVSQPLQKWHYLVQMKKNNILFVRIWRSSMEGGCLFFSYGMTVVKYCKTIRGGRQTIKDRTSNAWMLGEQTVLTVWLDQKIGMCSYWSVYRQCRNRKKKLSSWEEINLFFTAPTPKSVPEAVLNDRRESLHAEALRRKEAKRRSIGWELIKARKRLQENTVRWEKKPVENKGFSSIKRNMHKEDWNISLRCVCKNKVLTDPNVFSVWPCVVPAPPLSFFFFFSSSRCSFCRFCTSMSAEMKVFFTSFSNSSSSLRASCCTSSSENLRIFVSISARRSFSSATLRVLTPDP